MKTMTCKQLGGACDESFSAETFDEIAQLSRQHGMENMDDPAHLEAMDAMRELMNDQDAMEKWMQERKSEFEAAPEA